MDSLPRVVEDIHGVLKLYSDGYIYRDNDIKFNIPTQDDGSVIWKDHIFDDKNNLQLRLYIPVVSNSSPKLSLPIVYFFHGGGFCFGSCTWINNHNACLRLASSLQAVVVAPDYRLAPEHRLPAAIEDALGSLRWLQDQAHQDICEPWLQDRVDFDRVYIVGDSSGGNIAHHLAVQLGPGSPELTPVRVRGYVLMAPFFGGTIRTKSEAEGEPEPLLTLETLDRFWRLSLPVGKDADHPLANPFGALSRNLEAVKIDPILVIAGSHELMRDRVESYAKKLQDLGKKAEYVEFEAEHHGFFLNDPYSKSGERLLQEINHFMSKL